jgi:hypothetical protein
MTRARNLLLAAGYFLLAHYYRLMAAYHGTRAKALRWMARNGL